MNKEALPQLRHNLIKAKYIFLRAIRHTPTVDEIRAMHEAKKAQDIRSKFIDLHDRLDTFAFTMEKHPKKKQSNF